MDNLDGERQNENRATELPLRENSTRSTGLIIIGVMILIIFATMMFQIVGDRSTPNSSQKKEIAQNQTNPTTPKIDPIAYRKTFTAECVQTPSLKNWCSCAYDYYT